MKEDEKYMQRCIELAARARGKTTPNPMVGCVIVKNGKVIAEGYHKKAGKAHAEVEALKKAGRKASGATMYVSLEPCSHYGRTPPCTEAIIKAKVKQVIVAMEDPHRVVKGQKVLKKAGVQFKSGVLEKEARRLNEVYLKYLKTGMPFVTVKVGVTLDGNIATSTGDSKYISSKRMLKEVHKLRTEVDAVLVGANTVRRDNPRLTPRLVKGKNPLKVVVDSKARISLNCNLMQNPSQLVLAVTRAAPKPRIDKLAKKGVNVIICKSKNGYVDLKELMRSLGKLEVTSVLIEGGATVNASAIKAGIVDKILFNYSPKLLGAGISAIGDLGIKRIKDTIPVKNIEVHRIGDELQVQGYL